MATEVKPSKCGDRQSACARIRRDATAGPSGHWLRVAAKATPPTHTREGLALGEDTRPALSGFLLAPPKELPGVFNGILAYSSLSRGDVLNRGSNPGRSYSWCDLLTTALERLPICY